ncbi:MAG: hypothetical protein JWN14_3191 [Chthonomonadales bacterium]|nr:hypothetical protein [Chthonomonadales bacterium]
MVSSVMELFVRGAVLCLLAALALLLLRRTAAAYRHLLCVLALGGLLALPLAPRLMPPLLLLPTPPSPATAKRGIISKEETGGMIEKASKSADPLPTDSGSVVPPSALGAAAPHQRRSWNATATLVVIWGLGAAVLLIRLLVALLRLRRLEAESCSAILGSVPIRVHAQIRTPLTWGIRRSVILLPAGLLSGDLRVCESALRHEQAHIARWDWMWNLLAETVCALCWFQPGAWWLRSRMRFESERACDDRVLVSGIAGPDYATHLLEIARSTYTQEVAPAMTQSGGMEERMRHILDDARPRYTSTKWLIVSAPLALALLSLAAVRVSARPTEAKRQTNTGEAAVELKGAASNGDAPAQAPATQAGTLHDGSTNTVPAQEQAGVAWGPGREVQAGLAMTNRYGGADQHTGLYVFSVYLRNRTNRILNVNCPGFDGLTVPGDDTEYSTLIQTPSIFCSPHLEDSKGKAMDIGFHLGTDAREIALKPGQVVMVSHWMLRTIDREAKDERRAKFTLAAFVEPGKYRISCDVSATWGNKEGKHTVLHTGKTAFDVTGEDLQRK